MALQWLRPPPHPHPPCAERTDVVRVEVLGSRNRRPRAASNPDLAPWNPDRTPWNPDRLIVLLTFDAERPKRPKSARGGDAGRFVKRIFIDPLMAEAFLAAQIQTRTCWQRFLISVLGRFDVDRCLAWAPEDSWYEAHTRGAASALCCDAEEDDWVAPDGDVLGMVYALPVELMELVLEFYPRVPAICGAARAFEFMWLCRTFPTHTISVGLWNSLANACITLRDVCIMRAVAGSRQHNRYDAVQLILDCFGPGSTLRSDNIRSQMLLAFAHIFGPRDVEGLRRGRLRLRARPLRRVPDA